MGGGGPIAFLSLEGRVFSVAGDSDTQTKKGGTENELQMNGDGTGRVIKTAVGWGLKGANVSIDNDNEDLEYITELQESNNTFDFMAEYADGSSRQGTATITGEVLYSSANGVATVNFEGPGEFSLQ